MVTLFCCFLACGEKREEVLGQWSLGLQLTKNKRPRVSPLVLYDFSARCLKFFYPILRVRNKGIVTGSDEI